jgi:hypothetical protein
MTMRVMFSACSERQKVSRDSADSAFQRNMRAYFAGRRT